MSETESPKPRTVPFCITEPTRIDARRYYDEDFFRLEAKYLWPHVWQMACRLEEIPELGDWAEYKILDKSVIVVHTKDGIKAFHNACRHRGVQLVSGHGNCAVNGFVCPFHGWRYGMDGKNTFVFGRNKFREADLEPADLGLVPCRVELWGGCAFINFDDNAPPLIDGLGPAAERMDARHVGELKVEWWRSAILPVNWKLAMEAFMEGYHVMATHPQLHKIMVPEMLVFGPDAPASAPPPPSSASVRDYVDGMISFLDRLNDGMAGMVDSAELAIAKSLREMELPEDLGAGIMAFHMRLNQEITQQGRARGLPVPDLNEVAAKYPFVALEFFFPHYFLLPMFSAMSSYRIRPLTPETCLFEIWSLAHLPKDEERESLLAPEPSRHDDPSFPEIPQQDYSNLPLQQLGLHAQGFEFMRLSPDVEGMISNYQRVIDGYLAGAAPAKLAKAAGLACGGLDSPIVDIGL